jgi:hypothetical protein
VTEDPILELTIPENDSGRRTVRGYLCQLLHDLWREEESFESKRPFGNSGWQSDLIDPIMEAFSADEDQAHCLVAEAIARM